MTVFFGIVGLSCDLCHALRPENLSRKINGRWHCYQRPLRLILEVLCHEGNSFRFPASGSLFLPKDHQLTKLLLVSIPAVTLAVRPQLAHGFRCPAATLLFLFLMQA
jgi:hypothetical protein